MSKVVIPMNPELWESIRASEDPRDCIMKRGVQELEQRYGYDVRETGMVYEDPLYAQSARTAYLNAANTFAHRRKIPRTMVLEFHRPATRSRGQREAS